MNTQVSLSIVIPAFNEEKRLAKCLRTLAEYFGQEGLSAELVVVDDGSVDSTAEVARTTAESLPDLEFTLLQNGTNLGKGASVRRGMLQAHGRWTLLTDADLSTPVEEFAKLFDALQSEKVEIAIGSRDLPDSDVQIHQSNIRERSGKLYNVLVRWWFGLPFRDTQCGFKLFETEPCRILFQKQSVSRFSFDVEILLLARLQGLGIVEVPVIWRHDQGSRVHFLRDGTRMIFDLLGIASKYWTGAYRRALRKNPNSEEEGR